jgi:hypothetical protein
MPHETDDKVGYKNPPKHSQFKKGQSGNPKGRPRRKKSPGTALREALNETVTITENGRRHKVNKTEIIMKRAVNDAAKGDARARKEVFGMLSDLLRLERERASQNRDAPPHSAVVVLPHNNRDELDPELIAKYARVKNEHEAEKARERKRQGPANENNKEPSGGRRTA